MQESQLRMSASCLFEAEVYDVAFLNFLGLAEITDSGRDWYRVGYSALALGGFSKALEMFQKAKAKDPNSGNPEVDAMIALLYACSPNTEDRNGTRAIEIAKSLLHTPSDRWKTDTLLAAGHAEIGDFDTAVLHLMEALICCPAVRKPVIFARIAQYEKSQPFRISIEFIRQSLREFGNCVRCNANTNISQSNYSTRCLEMLGKREKLSD